MQKCIIGLKSVEYGSIELRSDQVVGHIHLPLPGVYSYEALGCTSTLRSRSAQGWKCRGGRLLIAPRGYNGHPVYPLLVFLLAHRQRCSARSLVCV